MGVVGIKYGMPIGMAITIMMMPVITSTMLMEMRPCSRKRNL